MARNYKLSIGVSIFLCLGISVAAHAYSYDELVKIVRAEEKVFGQADYGKSLDQRLEALESKIFGGPKTGSDSVRLTRICRNLGFDGPATTVTPAPFTVLVSPRAKAETSKSKSIHDKKIIASTSSSVLAPMISSLKQSNKEASSNKNSNKQTKNKAKKLEKALLKPAAQAAVAATPASDLAAQSSDASTQAVPPAQADENKPASSLGAFLIAIVVGIVAISFGMVTYLLLKVKNEVATPFTSQYKFEEDYEEEKEDQEDEHIQTNWDFVNQGSTSPLETAFVPENIEQAGITSQPLFETTNYFEQLPAKQEQESPSSTELEKSRVSVAYQSWTAPTSFLAALPVEQFNESIQSSASEFLQDEKYIQAGSSEQQSMPEHLAQIQQEAVLEQINEITLGDELADTQHVNQFIQHWNDENVDQRFFASDELTLSSLPPIPASVECNQVPEQFTVEPVVNPEFSLLLNSINKDQLNDIIETYGTDDNILTDPLEDFAYLCDLESSDVFAQIENTVERNESVPAEQAESYQLFEVPVAPKFSTVSNWKDKELNTSTETSHVPAAEKSDAGMMVENLSNEDFTANILLQLEKINLENLVQQTMDLPDEEEESYRALAQLLVDAAQQAVTPAQYAKQKRVPLYSKRALVTHAKSGVNLEGNLRELFSDKVST